LGAEVLKYGIVFENEVLVITEEGIDFCFVAKVEIIRGYSEIKMIQRWGKLYLPQM
jgi:hypothetical protein